MIGASTTALMGLGLQGELADIMGADYALVVGVGTTQAGAKAIIGDNAELSAASSQTDFVLPITQAIMEAVFAVNPSGTTARVWCPVGHTLNNVANANLSIATNKAAIFWQYKPKFWASLLTN